MKIALYNLWSTFWSVFKPLCETTKNLTHEFRTMFHTYTPWKRHKIWDQRKRQKPDVFRRYRNGKLAWYGWRPLPLSWRRPLSYGNQSIDLRSKFLYDNGLRHERVWSSNINSSAATFRLLISTQRFSNAFCCLTNSFILFLEIILSFSLFWILFESSSQLFQTLPSH